MIAYINIIHLLKMVNVLVNVEKNINRSIKDIVNLNVRKITKFKQKLKQNSKERVVILNIVPKITKI